MARNEETVGNTGAVSDVTGAASDVTGAATRNATSTAASTDANGHTTIDWKRKLTSRKFWLSVASFVTMLLVALGKSQETAAQVTSLIMAGATVIGYTIGEGLADGHGETVDGS